MLILPTTPIPTNIPQPFNHTPDDTMPFNLTTSTSSIYIHSPFFPSHLREMGFYLDEDAVLQKILGPPISIPPRVFTLYELQTYYNGQNGAPAYVSANGIVFDVTNNIAWATGSHFSLKPGNDYSSLFTVCHANNLAEMSKYAPILGRIVYA